MTQRLVIHPENPQLRLIRDAVNALQQGAVIAFPTDSAYALGCHLGDKKAQDRIRKIRQLDEHHNFTLICNDLSTLSTYARFDTALFRLLKAYTPGPYTFILEATKEVPKRFQHPKRRTIGVRLPDHAITQALIKELGEPLMSVTLILPEELEPLASPDDIYEKLHSKIDVLIDGGPQGFEPTTVVDFTSGTPVVMRRGKGDPGPFL